MSLIAAVMLTAASARVDSVYLTTADQRLAVRVTISGTPGMVAVHREGNAARVSITDAALGLQFAGGRHFSWTPVDGLAPAVVAASPVKLDRLEIAATDSEVSVLLHVPPDVSVDVRRDARGLLLVFRPPQETQPMQRVAEAPPPAPTIAAAPPETPSPTPEPKPTPQPERAAPRPVTPPPTATPASADTAELARRLFPTATAEPQTGASVAELYPQLFPAGVPQQSQPEAEVDVVAPDVGPDQGAVLGPFRVRASVDARYVDADTFLEGSQPTRDRYFEVQPHLLARAPVGTGTFSLEYSPVFRMFATYDQVNSSSHLVGAGLELPVGSRSTLTLNDRFRSGILDTRVVDPGGEYFTGLGSFRRNDADAHASIVIGPRLSLELAGAVGYVHFTEPSSFTDYDSRLVSAGFGFELTPTLRAIASYVYDTVPAAQDRPLIASTANSARFSLEGEILPLLTGELAVGFRSQDSPQAGEGGQAFSGVTFSASLLRELGREAKFSVYANRSTPVSAYDQNAFYVSTGVQGVLEVPLGAKFEARGGVGYQWNDYQTKVLELGAPRADRILGWFVGLRRPVSHSLALSGAYRREDRNSNVETFTTNAEGVYVQLEWDLFGAPPR